MANVRIYRPPYDWASDDPWADEEARECEQEDMDIFMAELEEME